MYSRWVSQSWSANYWSSLESIPPRQKNQQVEPTDQREYGGCILSSFLWVLGICTFFQPNMTERGWVALNSFHCLSWPYAQSVKWYVTLAGWLARGEVWVFDWCVHLIYNNILIRKIKWMTHNWYKQLVYNENVLILKTCITWYCHALHVLAHCITWLGLQFNREKVLMHPAVISFLHAHLPKLAPRMGDISGLYIDKHANLHQSELK